MFQNYLLPTFFVLSTLLLGYFIGLSAETPKALGVIAINVIVSALVASIVTARNYGSRLRSLLQIARLEDIKRELVEEMDGKRFFSHEDLRLIESSHNTSEIWVVTSDLTFDVSKEGESFKSVTQRNTKERKISYRYIVPEHIGTAAENALMDGLDKRKVKVLRLPRDQWRSLPYSDGAIVIYNPTSAEGKDPCRLFFDFPSKDEPIWAEVDSRMAVEWADRIGRML